MKTYGWIRLRVSKVYPTKQEAIEYGFAEGEEHSIDIRIIAKDNELILRVRDDSRPFNIVERYRMVSMEDKNPTKNIGIRMVMNMSSDVKYVSTLGTNNLIIRI